MDRENKSEWLDKEEYGHIFKEYYSELCFHAKKIVAQKEDGEDIVSEVFTKLQEKCNQVQITESWKAYLYKGVSNACFKYLEHKNVVQKYNEYTQAMYNNNDWLRTCDDDNPESRLIVKEKACAIEEAMDALPEHHRQILDLAIFDELTHHKIAVKLGIPPGSVGPKIIRAKEKLLKLIENKV